jgi:hypothetical protein
MAMLWAVANPLIISGLYPSITFCLKKRGVTVIGGVFTWPQ